MRSASELAKSALQLCEIDSPIGHEAQIADYVERWAKGLFPSEQIRRHSHSFVLGSLDDAKPTVALIGHLDTVPLHPRAGRPRIEGDRLIGRGSSDMKGALAVMMALAEDLPADKRAYNLAFIFYEREEGPYLESGLGLLMDKVPELKKVKFGIAMEPTDNVVQVGCTGSIHAALHFQGKSAHSARPWQGENAIHRAGPFLGELLALQPREVNLSGYSFREVFSITLAKGGLARNVVPDGFELNLNYRFAPGKSVEAAQEDVRKLVAGRAHIEFKDLAPAGRVCADNPLFQALLSTTGLPAAPKQAWTDVARFSVLGVDAVNFGPGETAQAHQEDESTSIGALGVAYQKLAAFLSK
jgi:succinyl-diaminopimelate desuccinylase